MTVHVNERVAVDVPSEAVVVTVYMPALAVIVPLITPVLLFTLTPAGNPLAPYCSADPSGSLATICTDTDVPVVCD